MVLMTNTLSQTKDIIFSVPCTCVDGRTQGARYSCAGGSIGLLIEILNGFEQDLKQALKTTELESIMCGLASQVAPLYWHTDQHAIDVLLARLALPADQVLTDLNPTQQQAFIELATHADHQGCGHIRLLLKQPVSYRVNPDLVQRVMRAHLKLWFAQQPKIIFEVLQGTHQEAAIIILDAGPDDEITAETQLIHAEGQFFCHRPLKYELIKRLVQGLADQGWTYFLNQATTPICERHDAAAEKTLGVIAHYLPEQHFCLDHTAPLPREQS